jgi:hypothetical protein
LYGVNIRGASAHGCLSSLQAMEPVFHCDGNAIHRDTFGLAFGDLAFQKGNRDPCLLGAS